MSEHDLVKRYFEICNTTLRLNKTRFPFKQILGAASINGAGQKVEMRVTSDLGIKKYIVYLDNGSIVVNPHEACETCGCVREWKLEPHYLRSVISRPELYIGNPAKLDWTWMYNQSGIYKSLQGNSEEHAAQEN